MTEVAQASRGIIEIDPPELRELLSRGRALVIDVREPDEHARERIEGAVLMPLSRFDPAEIPPDGDRTVVLHCRSGGRATEAANRLLAAGRPAVTHLRGGFQAWRSAGLPIRENRRVPISIMRQVQITAGSLVLAGAILAATVNPWFILLSGFIGAGLVFAGLSGTCGMAALLGVMPWNRAAACPKS